MNPLRTAIVAGLVVAAVLGAGLAGAALSDSSGWAARVNGRQIPEDEFLEDLRELRANQEVFAGFLDQTGDTRFPDGAVQSQLAAGWLARLVEDAFATEELAARGLQVTSQHRALAEQAVASAGAAWDAFGPEFQARELARTAREIAITEALTPEITEADVQALYEENKEQFLTVCFRQIVVGTREQAEELRAQLAAGAEFEELAREHSIDASASEGGDVGCQPRFSNPEPLDSTLFTAEPGVVTEPVETQFGFHLARVDRQELTPLESVRAQLEEYLQGQGSTAYGEFVFGALQDADIEISPRYGSFTPDDFEGRFVTPPEAPSPPDELPVQGAPTGEPSLFGP